jgi:hypothetical protein
MRNEYSDAALEGEDHAFDAGKYGVMTRPTPAIDKPEADWMQAAMRDRRRVVSRFGTRGFSRWQRTGIAPYAAGRAS